MIVGDYLVSIYLSKWIHVVVCAPGSIPTEAMQSEGGAA